MTVTLKNINSPVNMEDRQRIKNKGILGVTNQLDSKSCGKKTSIMLESKNNAAG